MGKINKNAIETTLPYVECARAKNPLMVLYESPIWWWEAEGVRGGVVKLANIVTVGDNGSTLG